MMWREYISTVCGHLTGDGQVDPGAVSCRVVRTTDVDDRTLVPALVRQPYVGDLEWRVVAVDEQSRSAEIVGVDVRRKTIQLDVDGYLDALFVPLHHVLGGPGWSTTSRHVVDWRRRDVAVKHDTGSDDGRLANWPTSDETQLGGSVERRRTGGQRQRQWRSEGWVVHHRRWVVMSHVSCYFTSTEKQYVYNS